MKFRTENKPAPGELVLLQGFLNTRSDELGIEDLPDPSSARSWLKQAGLWTSPKGLSAQDHRELQAFRETLRSYVQKPTATEFITALNEHASAVKLGLELSLDGALQVKVCSVGLDESVGQLLRIAQESMLQGTWSRLKCCELESCGWAFYDITKNHSGRWCSMRSCGSRHKARQYLKRQAAAK